MDLERLRGAFPVTHELVYLNHAAVAPASTSVAAAVVDFMRENVRFGALHYDRWLARAEEVRAMAARLIDASPSEVAFVKNTSTAISIVANGIDWREGDNVVTAECEFPANVYPWMNLASRGVETRFVKEREGRVRVGDIAAAMDGRTRLVSISWVEFLSGYRNDLAAVGRLCRERGALFCVDAIQGLGALRLSVRDTPVDFLAADGHKWLLGPEGIGLFYCSERVIDRLHPAVVGWNSVVDAGEYLPHRFKLKEDAGKFEEGSPNMLGIHALGGALSLIEEAGIDGIEARVLALTARIMEGLDGAGAEVLSPRGEGERSGIVLFNAPAGRKGNGELFGRLMKNRVFCSLRSGFLRVSPHFYNTEEEIDRFIGVVEGGP